MATLDLGSVTIDDAIVAKVQDAFGQATLTKLRDVARLLVRRYLREEAIKRYLAKIEAQYEQDSADQQAQEQTELEAGWPEP